MALSDILSKIDQETADKIAQLKKEFEEKMAKLKRENEARQKKIDEKMHEKVEENSKKIIEKTESLAQREAKNQLLEAKRKIIDSALTQAVEELSQSKDYESILANILKKTPLDSDDIVIVPAKGKESATKKAIKESGKEYFLSDKSEDIQGGFILKTAKIEIDNSFETIIKEQLREDLEIKLHKLLFT